MTHSAGMNWSDQTRNRVAELEAQLAAKEEELQEERERYRELRHRIRNDLQGLTALLAAQAKTATDPDSCGRCILRLRSAVELHNALDDDGSASISMADYLRALSDTRRKAFEDRIRVDTFVEQDIYLDYRSAQCVGLVYVEAATNALKHAFPGGGAGRIEVRLRRLGDELELSVADDGVGFDPGSALRGDGIELMKGLARQLGGELRFERLSRGTKARLLFAAARD